MMVGKKLDECIRELRSQEKIHKIWSASDIRPFLMGSFSSRTLSVYPNNASTSPDGLIKGDAIKKGMKPKYYRLGRGKFVLIEEYYGGLESQPKEEQLKRLSHQPKIGEEKPIDQQAVRLQLKKDPSLRRGESISERLITVFPTKQGLLKYAGLFAEEYRRNSDSFNLYHSIIVRQRNTQLSELVQDQSFHDLIYKTLISWDMNFRRARLIPFPEFSASIKEASARIISLAEFSMDGLEKEPCTAVITSLEDVFRSIKVMASRSQIVGVSKTLHFLLPRLVMPIDGKYTLKLLFGYRVYKRSLSGELALFHKIFLAFWELAARLGMSRLDEEKTGWNTTVPKIIDNAIIGYLRNRQGREHVGIER